VQAIRYVGGVIDGTEDDPRGFWYNGRFIFFVKGGDGTGDDGDDANGDDEDVGDEDEDESSDEDEEEKEGSGGKDKSQKISLTTRQLKEKMEKKAERRLLNLAKENGFDTIESFQKFLKTAKKKSGEEGEELSDLRERATKAESERDKLRTKAKKSALERIVEKEASKLGFIDPDDAFGLGRFSAEDEELFDDDDDVDEDEVIERLEALAKKKKHLLKGDKEESEPRRSNAPNPQRNSGTKNLSKDEQEKLKKRFKILSGEGLNAFR
jgi:hypothetical protein